jgi:hypothetical protein
MPKTKIKPKTAIYLVVTVSPEGVVAIAVESLKVLLEDNRGEQQP